MLAAFLKANGFEQDFAALGYSVDEIFGGLSEETAKMYTSYTWKKVPCSVEGIEKAYVIHAVPPTELMEEKAWEEWFVQFGKKEHHVLFLHKNDECTEEIMIPADDKDHPEEIAGKYWYYICSESSLPYFR